VPGAAGQGLGKAPGQGALDGVSGDWERRRPIRVLGHLGMAPGSPARSAAEAAQADGGSGAPPGCVRRPATGLVTPQVATRMRLDYPSDGTMRVSHETIYSWFHLLPKGALKSTVIQGMRQGKEQPVL